MKIISPNIIAVKSFLHNVEKGFYVYNKKNDKLGRSGLPYGKSGLQTAIKNLEEEIGHSKIRLYEAEANKEGWEETLRITEEGTEDYQDIQEKLEHLDVTISNLKLDIEEKEEIQKEYQNKLDNWGKKKPKEKEYLTLRELQNKYPNEKFGLNDYPRVFTASEQNQNRD